MHTRARAHTHTRTHARTQDLNPDCVSDLAKAAHAVDPIIIYGKDDDEETGRTTIPEDWKKLVMNWVIVGYYDKQAHPNKSVEQLQELINNATKEYKVFLFLEDEKFVTQELVQAARADNGRVFYQLADHVLPAFAPVGRMLCSQLSGNGEVERAHKITGGTYTKVNPNALLVPVG